MTSFHTASRVAAVICLLLAGPVFADSPEYEVKAAFIFNFAKFVQWPESAFGQDNELALCVVGEDPFGNALDTLEGRTVQDRTIKLYRVETPTTVEHCHIAFIAQPKSANNDTVTARIAEKGGILTISDVDGFLEAGGTIELRLVNGKIRFGVNLDAARQAELDISSRLLRLAMELQNEGADS